MVELYKIVNQNGSVITYVGYYSDSRTYYLTEDQSLAVPVSFECCKKIIEKLGDGWLPERLVFRKSINIKPQKANSEIKFDNSLA